MKFLVTGGAGYIGVPLITLLLEKGHQVICLDRLFFGREPLGKIIDNSDLQVLRDDIRWFDPEVLKQVEVVIDLAALSNDPSGELNPSKTYDINYLGRVRVAKLSKEFGVRRYILASTCSVYGFYDEILSEDSATKPLTTYARSALLAERDVLQLQSKDFVVVIPRFATVYGVSPRMRFDLAINAMVLKLYQSQEISVMRDGRQWRPFVHVKDVAKAYALLSECESDNVNGQIINVGSNEQNYQLYPLAELLGNAIGKPYEIQWYGDPDRRSYRVSFDKIGRILDFKPDFSPKEGAGEIYRALENGSTSDTLRTRTVDWYKHLLDSERLIKQVMLKEAIL